MKFLCPACERLADISSFRIEGAGLWLTCSRCAAESELVRAPMPAEVDSNVIPLHPATDAFDPPDDRCPKCIAPRAADGLICGRCGLVYSNFDPDQLRVPDSLTAEWTQLTGNWAEVSNHDRVIASALAGGWLASVGRLYRIRLARFPGDPLASHGLARVVERSAAMSLPAKIAGAPVKPRWPYAVVGVLAVFMVWLVIMLLRALQRAGHS